MREIVTNLLKAALMECCPPRFIEKVTRHPCFALAVLDAEQDLEAFSMKDPASQGAATAIAFGYSSYKAVVHYRLAHALLLMAPANQAELIEFHANAMLISCRGKLMSGAEIHIRSQIGRRFVLDHGCGTVIGETAVIGDDCYMLGGVTLGATGIAGNASNKRHPTVGNRVQIGAFARLFGNVHVGDDVFIGPHCVIKEDIPPGSVVTLKSELQITRRRQYRPASNTLITAQA
ncbi:serine O-acetyltransferase [Caballeronia sp. DA-9]|uniref:serine O-acetyltransferase n=1 Tax=Caballeronia sp. DA-9 TaxID=3436237 RepID=UPI003F676F94